MNEENNNLNTEETTETAATEETTETAATEETAETAATEETAEAAATEETTEAAVTEETTEAAADTAAAEQPKKSYTGVVIGAVVLVVVIAAAVLCKMYGAKLFNKYNRMGYINTSGNTIGEIADLSGMSLEEFLDTYGLPKDMPANTEESAAFYNIPTGVFAEMFYNADFETLKSEFELGDDITEDTPWGVAQGNIKVGLYLDSDEEMLARFKEYYGLGDDVTADTLWKEVRNIVDLKDKEVAEEQKKAQEEALKAEEDAADSTAAPADETADSTAAPADETAAADETATAAPADTAQ